MGYTIEWADALEKRVIDQKQHFVSLAQSGHFTVGELGKKGRAIYTTFGQERMRH